MTGRANLAVAPHAFTRRDLELLQFLARGTSTAQIATALSVSRNTARTKIRRVQHKLDVTCSSAAVQAARDRGVLGVPEPRRATG